MASAFDLIREAAAVRQNQENQNIGQQFNKLGDNGYAIAATAGSKEGAETASPIEQDIRELSPREMILKHGGNAIPLVNRSGVAASKLITDAVTTSRSGDQIAADTVTGVGLGVANTFGNIGAAAAGLVNPVWGVSAAQKMKQLNEFGQSTQSPGLQATRRISQAQDRMFDRDSDAQTKKDAQVDGDFIAGLKSIGRGALRAASNMDAAEIGDITASGVGSVLAGAPLALGRAALVPLSTAVTEGSGAFVDTANRVFETPLTEMVKNPKYQKLIAQGYSDAQARTALANTAGLVSGAITAPVAAITGKFTSGFEANPLGPVTARTAAANLISEAAEEGIVSAASGLSGNAAVQKYGDTSQLLSQGVGQQFVEGVVGGVTTSGTLQAPGVVGSSLGAGAELAKDALAKRAAAVQERVNQDSPIASKKVQEAIAEKIQERMDPVKEEELQSAIQAAAEAVPDKPEMAQELTGYINKVDSLLSFDTTEIVPQLAPTLQEDLGTSANRLDALEKLHSFINDETQSETDRATATLYAYNMLNTVTSSILEGNSLVSDIDPANPIHEKLSGYWGVLSNIEASPMMKELKAVLLDQAAQATAQVSEENLNQETAELVAVQAVEDPTNIPADKADMVLRHANEGRIRLSPEQRAALTNASTLVRAADAYYSTLENTDNLSGKEAVNKEITVAPEAGSKGMSAAQYARDIYRAVAAGADSTAASLIDQFQKFVESHQNKVDALNRHLETRSPDGEKYQTIDWETNSDWFESEKGLFVYPSNAKSVSLAQTVAAEAQYLTDVFNGLATAFPQLGYAPMGQTALSPTVANLKISSIKKEGKKPAEQPVQKKEEAKVEAPVEKKEVPAPAPQAEPAPAKPKPAPNKVQDAVDQVKEALSSFGSLPAAEGEAPKPKKSPKPVLEQKTEATIASVKDAFKAFDEQIAGKPEPEATKEPEQEVDELDAPEDPGSSVNALYPNLVGGVKNQFAKAFKLVTTPVSRLVGAEGALATILEALNNPAKFTGKETSLFVDADTRQDYRELLKKSRNVARQMVSRFETALKKPSGKIWGNKTFGEVMASGTDVSIYPNTRALALSVLNDQGKPQYDMDILQQGILAGVSWLTTMDKKGATIDEERAAKILGISEDQVTPKDLLILNNGTLSLSAVDSLSQKLVQYMGIKRDNNQPLGISQGIIEGFAKEIIQSMVELGYLEYSTDFASNGQEYGSLKLGKDVLGKGIIKNPELLDSLVLFEPEYHYNFGDSRPPVPNTQMHSDVPLTASEKKAIEVMNNTPNYLNIPMLSLFTGMGEDMVVDLFAAGALNESDMNVAHYESEMGKNVNAINAFREMQDTYAAALSHAQATNTPIEDVQQFYGYNMSSVARMQQLAKYGSQSSKIMREVVMPTKKTFDPANEDHRRVFNIGLAQALGIKVHKEPSYEVLLENLNKLTSGPLRPLMDNLSKWVQGMDASDPFAESNRVSTELATQIKESFAAAEVDLTPVAMMALIEQARLENHTEGDFTTFMYVEADGVTNGVVNALVNFDAGDFSEEWLYTVAKGGVFFDNAEGTTVNTHQAVDKVDIYSEVGKATAHAQAMNRDMFSSDPALSKQLNYAESLAQIFFPGIALDKNGNLTFHRKVTKKPVTKKTYGSGAEGIANGLVKDIVSSVQERMTDLHLARKKDPNISPAQAMFGKDSSSPDEANKRYEDFSKAWEALSNEVPIYDFKRKQYELVYSPVNKESGSVLEYKVSSERFANLSKNLEVFVVSSMVQGTEKVMGPQVMSTLKAIQSLTNTQSVYASILYKKRIAEVMAEKEQNDPDYYKSSFLTPNEIKKIQKEVLATGVTINPNGQTLMIPSMKDKIAGVAPTFSTSLTGSMKTDPMVRGYSAAGVRAIPVLNIATGDAFMIQDFVKTGSNAEGTLPVFDGINLPVTTAMDQSVAANTSAMNSWRNNRVQSVVDAMQKFADHMNLDNFTKDELVELALTMLPKKLVAKATPEMLKSAVQNKLDYLKAKADSAQARINVMQKVGMTVDQMASLQAPYQKKGTVALPTDPDEKLAKLNELYKEELDAIKGERKKTKDQEKETEKVLSDLVPATETGVRKISVDALMDKLKEGIPSNLKAVFARLIRSSEAKNMNFVFGSEQALREYAKSQGVTYSGGAEGFISFGTNTIYLVNPSVETAVHELVHAASLHALLDYYSGNSQALEATVKRLEALMDQFLDMEGTIPVMGSSVQDAYISAVNAIRDAGFQYGLSTPEGKVAMLNEFMAWGLTNKNLSALLKDTEAGPLARIAKAAWEAIKEFVFGNKYTPPAKKDMYSNLLFNSSILMQVQPSIAVQDAGIVLNHSSASLRQLKDRLNSKVMSNLKTPTDKLKTQRAVLASIDLAATAQAAGFTMTPEEITVFSSLATSLSTGLELDAGLMTRLGEIHSHVLRNLKAADFGVNGQSKFDLLTGKSALIDSSGKSDMLATFLGLALTNDEFRTILNGKKLPKRTKEKGETLDETLTNLGNYVMDSLSTKLAGEGNAASVRQALDSLTDKLNQRVQDNQTLLEQLSTPTGSFIDKANAKVAEAIATAGDKIAKVGESLEGSSNKYIKAAGQVLQISAGLTSDERAEVVAEGVLATLNRTDALEPLRTLMYDLIGNVKATRPAMQLAKLVKTTVQQDRQNYRERVPQVIRKMFKTPLSKDQWSSLNRSVAKTDLVSLMGTFSRQQFNEFLVDPSRVTQEIAALKAKIGTDKNGALLIKKAEQLAKFMQTGERGANLLRNAFAIANLPGENVSITVPNNAMLNQIDSLVSLLALENLSQGDKDLLSSLVRDQPEGLAFLISYMQGQRKDELSKMTPNSKMNHYKGHIPQKTKEGVEIRVVPDSQYSEMVYLGFTRVGNYNGSALNKTTGSHGYYISTVGTKSAFRQGIFQIARNSVSGVDANSGLTLMGTAGAILDKKELAKYAGRLGTDAGLENLSPVYDEKGVLIALERTMDPEKLELLNLSTDIAENIGMWRGRQVEEHQANVSNLALIDVLDKMHDEGNPSEFVNVFESKDPVIMAAVANLTSPTRKAIAKKFGKDKLWVRRDMLNDVLGYHAASVGDAWTGRSRWSKPTQEAAKNAAIAVFGSKAFQYAMQSEKFLQGLVSTAKTTIVVKSVVVPVANMVSNVFQLAMRGVPVASIVRGIPKKIAEVSAYDRGRYRIIELEARLRAAEGVNNRPLTQKIKAEIQSINDGFRRMSIWPLIERGEYSAVSDATTPGEDNGILQGKLADTVEGWVDKLPTGVRTAGKYALITKDTALFQGLQKSVMYGDFIAKALLFDDQVKRLKKNPSDVLDQIQEEYVNYDKLPGRWRDGLESNGLLWFYNYKLRITKIALSIMRNNPVHALLASTAAAPVDVFGDVGLPTTDNVFTKLFEGSLGPSIGYGMGLRAPGMNPFAAAF